MKKITFLLMFFIVLFTSCGKEKSFDENLRKAMLSLGYTLGYSAEACGEIGQTWYAAIYDDKTPSGKYCSDFNDALNETYESLKKSGKIDSIYFYKNELIENTSKLTPPPSSRKECYDDFVEIVGEVSSFSRMATEPSGSYNSYKEQFEEKVENITRLVEQFRIKYSGLTTK